MASRSTKLAALLMPLVFGVGAWSIFTRPWDTPTERAHRLCVACGIDHDEVDMLIDGVRD